MALSHTSRPVADCGDPVRQLHEELQDARDLARLARAAGRLRDDPLRLRTTLTALLHDQMRLADIAEECFVHSNGFAKVVLHAGKDYGIRLHVWPVKRLSLAGDTNPHGHRWDFASWIVAGTLREMIFIEDPTGEPIARFSYHGIDNGVTVMQPAGTAALKIVHVIDRPAGNVYTRSRSELHTAAPLGSELVASLVLQRPHAPEPADVYCVEPTQPEPLPKLSIHQVTELLAAVADSLA